VTKDPKFPEGKGTPAKKSGPALKVQAKVQSKVQARVQAKTTEQIKEKAVTLAAAAVLALPLALAPSPVAAQVEAAPPISPTAPVSPNETTTAVGQEGTLIIRMERTFTVLGVGDGHTVFKAADGETFYIDAATGDKQPVTADYFLGRDESKDGRSAGRIRFPNIMIVSILGVDAHGNTIMRNARNETFTLDPRTGNKVLIKWPK
jgi:hypothetical protein